MTKIIVIGDVMLDKYSYGSVKRLNPEGPNPLVNIEHEEYKLGGAANVAANIASLSDDVGLIGVVGEDHHGKKFSSLCESSNIHIFPLVVGAPTITKQRFIETTYQQQLLRVDYEQKYMLKKNHIEMIITVLQQFDPQYIIISDYNKGIVDKELIDALKTYAKIHEVQILVDAKPNNLTHFEGVYLLKPNFKEFRQMVGNEELLNDEEAIKAYGIPFVATHKLNLVITRGDKGAILITQDGQFYSLPTEAKQVFDVTGAGDTFLAAIVHALAHGYDLKSAVELGNKASGIAVGKIGTATVTNQELGI